MEPGTRVRVKYPFDVTFGDTYSVASVDPAGVVYLQGIEGGFDPMYLEVDDGHQQ